MNIIGIHDGHNAAVALIRDGKIVYALQEERVSRVKNQQGFPRRALEALLRDTGIAPLEVDAWVYAGWEQYLGPEDRNGLIGAYKKAASASNWLRRMLRQTPLRTARQEAKRRARIARLEEVGVSRERIHFIDHHMSHAYSAYYGSPWRGEDVLVVTCDGAGDGLCASVCLPQQDGTLKRIGSVAEEHSIGILWALITSYLGMVPNEHEYKLMGMAPYAHQERSEAIAGLIGSWFKRETDPLKGWRRSGGLPDVHYAYHFIRSHFELKRLDDICGGLQLFTEEFIASWIKDLLDKTGKKRLALAGGLFMNVKLNKKIMELPEVEEIFVFPSCGDETNVFGASFAFLAQRGEGEGISPLGSFCLGPNIDGDKVESVLGELSQDHLEIRVFDRPDELHEKIAELLAGGEVVARCGGREEFGARSLGNRSILARADNPLVVEQINAMVKKRDFWMPFASALLAEDEERCLHNPKKVRAPYMILTFDTKPEAKRGLIAGMHPRDHTLRAQVVDDELYPEFADILQRFKKRTGIGGLLNTSYNLHGYPLVHSAKDAVEVFLQSGLRHLVLANALLSKTK